MVKYYNPVEIIFGSSSIEQISEVARKYTLNKNIVVIASKFLRRLGILQKINNILVNDGFNCTNYENVKINPTFNSIREISQFTSDNDYGLVVGIGGGSVLDSAKCASILANNEGDVSNYLEKNEEIKNSGIPLILVPTTAGTGSEVTMWATVWRNQEGFKKKYSLSNVKMYAKAAILDPEMTISLPPELTAITGLDALSQAIEAYWSKNHNPISDEHALNAISLIIENLEKAYKKPSEIKYREKMLLGSLEAGLAFSNTKTTVVHSVSYPISAYFNVPHGLACALTLGSFLEFNSIPDENNLPEAPDRIATISKLLDANNSRESKERIESLMTNMNLPTTLTQLGISKKDLEILISEGFTKGRFENNPRKVTKNDLYKILENIL